MVAAKMEDPTYAEFVDMKRVMRKNSFGEPFEIICGHVKGKMESGEATGDRPFLYLVKEDEAFIVGGDPASLAAIDIAPTALARIRADRISRQKSWCPANVRFWPKADMR